MSRVSATQLARARLVLVSNPMLTTVCAVVSVTLCMEDQRPCVLRNACQAWHAGSLDIIDLRMPPPLPLLHFG